MILLYEQIKMLFSLFKKMTPDNDRIHVLSKTNSLNWFRHWRNIQFYEWIKTCYWLCYLVEIILYLTKNLWKVNNPNNSIYKIFSREWSMNRGTYPDMYICASICIMDVLCELLSFLTYYLYFLQVLQPTAVYSTKQWQNNARIRQEINYKPDVSGNLI